jgi:hypothetical protein
MKKTLILFILLCFLIVCIFFIKQLNTNPDNIKKDLSLPETQTELYYGKKLSTLTSNILNEQNVTALSQVNCKKISDAQFVTIGTVFTDMMFGNDQIRKQLDVEEGLQNTTRAYLQSGKYYLTCPNDWTSTFPTPQTQQEYGEELNNQIVSVLQTQNVNSTKELSCKRITDAQFIQVGVANMDLMIGNDEVHAQIEKLLDEKGSQYLRETHIQSGKYAFGCR